MGISCKINNDVSKLTNEPYIYIIRWKIKQLIFHDD